MIALEPMLPEQFNEWLQLSVKEYAESKTKAGNVAAEKAQEDSAREFKELLPDGLNTADSYIFNATDEESNQIVGTLWIKIRSEQRDVFIYGIRMCEDFRGKGFGKQTLQALEAFIKERDFPPKISLHVFGDNEIALNLYRSAGFEATNIRMSKVIGG
ncbi:GNAT family N-acetyltransferase [Paenibacillus chitinolyticus]|uniref:GNAT family N-acetyltransferase n=1 Tax=Paenibacillus chitinolyticus TaxID=79263 RepID=UPI00386B174F